MNIKKLVIGIIAAMAAFVGQAESSAPFRLSLKSDGVRTSLGDETLTYSSQWDGGDGAPGGSFVGFAICAGRIYKVE
jgi:hypothetical protein